MTTRSTRAVAAAIVAAAFWRADGLSRYHDDWVMADAALRAVSESAAWGFIVQPFGQHWSPAWMAFEVANVRVAGVHSAQLIRATVMLLALAALLVFARTARRAGLGVPAVVAGMFTLGVHHLNALGYYSFDCYSQVAADLAAWWSVSLALAAADAAAPAEARRRLAGALALLGAGLLVKEQALAAVAGLVVVAAWYSTAERLDAGRRRQLWGGALVALGLGAAFAALRWWMGRAFDAEGAYALCVSCVPANAAVLLGAALLPYNTLDVYLALDNPRLLWPLLAAAGGGVFVVLLLLVTGLRWRRARQPGQAPAGLVVLLGVSSTLPVAALAHVGELHAHAPLYWWALLVALAVDGWWRRAVRPTGRAVVVAASAIYALSLYAGLQANLGEMRRTGERTREWIARVDEAAAGLPSGALVLVRGVHDLKAPGDYSLYRLSSPGMLLRGTLGLTLSIRPDLRFEPMDEGLEAVRAGLDLGAYRDVFIMDVGPEIRVARWERP